MSAGFDRLSPALQHQIIHQLGFTELRPVQEQATHAILDGDNCVILAPTAGGKTEAAFFPLLSRIDAEDPQPVSVLYLSPIRALLNNQEPRVERLCSLIARRACKWHGDTTQSARKAFLKSPTDVLLITPESLEAMLMSPRVPALRLFRGLSAVIIDEVHAFADDDRGAHLAAVLERLTRLCRRDVQRIGLSATVGNPEAILSWLQGSSQRPGRIVDPGGDNVSPQLALDYVGDLDNAATVIKALHPGRKRLVFTDSRRNAEQLGKRLNQLQVLAYVMHGSLSASERRDAERAFAEGKDCVIVATSAMELGIDIGDLDHVLQIDSPPTVASFLQRMGRTGRRAGTVPNCTFLCTKPEAVLQAAALLELHARGYVEPVRPTLAGAHIYAHQTMALAIQTGGIPPAEVWTWLAGAAPFSGLQSEDRENLLTHMLATHILADHGGRLWLGPEGEKRYGRANFRALYAVFESPRLLTVRADTVDIGQVEAQFLQALESPDGRPPCFTLGGRPWLVTHTDWERGLCLVRPAPEGNAPRWNGGPRWLSYDLCQAMRALLTRDHEHPTGSARAKRELETQRAEYHFLRDSDSPLLEHSSEVTWWNFAGGAANLLLARLLEAELGEKIVASNLRLSFREGAAKSATATRDTLHTLRAETRPTETDTLRFAEAAKRGGRLSKFEPCLPDLLLQRFLATTLFDSASAHRALAAFGGSTGSRDSEGAR